MILIPNVLGEITCSSLRIRSVERQGNGIIIPSRFVHVTPYFVYVHNILNRLRPLPYPVYVVDSTHTPYFSPLHRVLSTGPETLGVWEKESRLG